MVNSYHELSRRLGVALKSEEERCRFVSEQAKIMLAFLEDVIIPMQHVTMKLYVISSYCSDGSKLKNRGNGASTILTICAP